MSKAKSADPYATPREMNPEELAKQKAIYDEVSAELVAAYRAAGVELTGGEARGRLMISKAAGIIAMQMTDVSALLMSTLDELPVSAAGYEAVLAFHKGVLAVLNESYEHVKRLAKDRTWPEPDKASQPPPRPQPTTPPNSDSTGGSTRWN